MARRCPWRYRAVCSRITYPATSRRISPGALPLTRQAATAPASAASRRGRSTPNTRSPPQRANAPGPSSCPRRRNTYRQLSHLSLIRFPLAWPPSACHPLACFLLVCFLLVCFLSCRLSEFFCLHMPLPSYSTVFFYSSICNGLMLESKPYANTNCVNCLKIVRQIPMLLSGMSTDNLLPQHHGLAV